VLGNAIDHHRRLNAYGLEDRRDDINRMVELSADSAPNFDTVPKHLARRLSTGKGITTRRKSASPGRTLSTCFSKSRPIIHRIETFRIQSIISALGDG
jgi:hypothetical protein